jgi:hypothetical protein
MDLYYIPIKSNENIKLIISKLDLDCYILQWPHYVLLLISRIIASNKQIYGYIFKRPNVQIFDFVLKNTYFERVCCYYVIHSIQNLCYDNCFPSNIGVKSAFLSVSSGHW